MAVRYPIFKARSEDLAWFHAIYAPRLSRCWMSHEKHPLPPPDPGTLPEGQGAFVVPDGPGTSGYWRLCITFGYEHIRAGDWPRTIAANPEIMDYAAYCRWPWPPK